MLVLSRKAHEKVLFPGLDASVEVVSVKGNVVRLGIEAPPSLTVLRAELLGLPGQALPPESRPADSELRHRLNNRLSTASVGLALLRKLHQHGMKDELDATIDRIEREICALHRDLEAAPPRPVARPADRPRKALLVEDDQNERELLASFLRLAGLHVDTAGDGLDALDYLHTRGRPDVLLLDMALPRCDGPTTVRTIRQDPAYAGLKIFAVTGHPPSHFGEDGGLHGVDRWFRKPLYAEDLLRDLTREMGAVGA
jgi:carbon storage regulator CsrA